MDETLVSYLPYFMLIFFDSELVLLATSRQQSGNHMATTWQPLGDQSPVAGHQSPVVGDQSPEPSHLSQEEETPSTASVRAEGTQVTITSDFVSKS
jgi:hypothetical protein